MRNRLLVAAGWTVLYVHGIFAGDSNPCASTDPVEMPYMSIPEMCGSAGRSRRLTIADAAQHHIATYRSASPSKPSTSIRRGKSVSPPRGKLCSSKSAVRKSLYLTSHGSPPKVNLGESIAHSTTEYDVYKSLTFEHTPLVVAGRSRIDIYTETLNLGTFDAVSQVQFRHYVKERHGQEMPGIIARCQFVQAGLGYFYDFSIARWWQCYVEQCRIEGRSPHHPEDREKIFSAAEYFLVAEDMRPIFLDIVPASNLKLDPTLGKILNFETHSIKSNDTSTGDRQRLANEWFTLGTYLSARKHYEASLAWLNKANLELQELQPACKYGHVLYAIAHAYWLRDMNNDWAAADHHEEHLVILGWLLKAKPRLKIELQSLDAARNLFGRVYEKIGEVANKQDPDKPIIRMNDNSLESARTLIARAFDRYSAVLSSLDNHEQGAEHEPSTSNDLSHDAAHMKPVLDALINILCLFERQQGLCAAAVASKMPTYAHYLVHWPHKEMLKEYQLENDRRYRDGLRKARAMLMKTAQLKISKMPTMGILSSPTH